MTNLEHYIIYKLLHKFYKPTVILIYMLLFLHEVSSGFGT